jgi:NADH pyrophosphatase NudC (nudix superfamily)
MEQANHPNNKLIFCPGCGSAQFNQVGARSKKCAQCGFHLYFNISAAVAAAIFNPEGKMLFARRAIEPYKGMLDLPGGFVDPLETAEQWLARELEEEMGAKVKKMSYFCSFPNIYPYSGLQVNTLDLVFFVELESLSGLKPMDDISAIEFYYPDEVNLDELPAESMKNIVKKINERNQHN